MKKLALAAALLAATGTALADGANGKQEEVNYGDPTASFSSLGVSRSADSSMINFQMGVGKNIFQFDYGFNDKQLHRDGDVRHNEGNQNYRGRVFHVEDGLGYSATVVGSHNGDGSGNDAALAGLMYKLQLSDKVMVFPMLDVGHQISKDANGNKSHTNIVQPGLFAMYALDGGHWLYANPKAQYITAEKEWVPSAEVGAGFMVTDNTSIGVRIDYTGSSRLTKEDTKVLVQANYYW